MPGEQEWSEAHEVFVQLQIEETRTIQPGKESLECVHQTKHSMWEKKEQWPFPPSSCTRNKGQQMRTAVTNFIERNAMFVANIECTIAG